jgi:tight adherence protein B
MQPFILGAIIFFISVIAIELLSYAYRSFRSPDRIKVLKRLRKSIYMEDEQGGTDIVKKKVLSEIPFLNSLLIKTPGMLKFDSLLTQANAKYPIGFYILLALFLALTGFLIGTLLIKNNLAALALLFIAGAFPFLYLTTLKRKRIQKFRRQLPEALDLMARALRAGHAFTNGMRLAADEFDDPLGPEFAETLDEINFGLSAPDALINLTKRIDCSEIKYFVVGVTLQRETGGNLAELMGTLSYLIREKFKFQGKVQTLAAEGKLSAIVLIAIPFLMTGWLHFSNPKYLATLFMDPIGKVMIIGAVVMMIIGIFVMKKFVTIEV